MMKTILPSLFAARPAGLLVLLAVLLGALPGIAAPKAGDPFPDVGAYGLEGDRKSVV